MLTRLIVSVLSDHDIHGTAVAYCTSASSCGMMMRRVVVNSLFLFGALPSHVFVFFPDTFAVVAMPATAPSYILLPEPVVPHSPRAVLSVPLKHSTVQWVL